MIFILFKFNYESCEYCFNCGKYRQMIFYFNISYNFYLYVQGDKRIETQKSDNHIFLMTFFGTKTKKKQFKKKL